MGSVKGLSLGSQVTLGLSVSRVVCQERKVPLIKISTSGIGIRARVF